jgi:hypothetical protein
VVANLRRERPANNPIGDGCFEMIVAIDAWNRLIAHLCAANTGGHMNLLFGFTAWAFHRHYNIVLVGHLSESPCGFCHSAQMKRESAPRESWWLLVQDNI